MHANISRQKPKQEKGGTSCSTSYTKQYIDLLCWCLLLATHQEFCCAENAIAQHTRHVDLTHRSLYQLSKVESLYMCCNTHQWMQESYMSPALIVSTSRHLRWCTSWTRGTHESKRLLLFCSHLREGSPLANRCARSPSGALHPINFSSRDIFVFEYKSFTAMITHRRPHPVMCGIYCHNGWYVFDNVLQQRSSTPRHITSMFPFL